MGGDIFFNSNWDVLGRRSIVQTSVWRHSAHLWVAGTISSDPGAIRRPWRKYLSVLPLTEATGTTISRHAAFIPTPPPPHPHSSAARPLSDREEAKGLWGLQVCRRPLLLLSGKHTEKSSRPQKTHVANTANNSQEAGGLLHRVLSCVSWSGLRTPPPELRAGPGLGEPVSLSMKENHGRGC